MNSPESQAGNPQFKKFSGPRPQIVPIARSIIMQELAPNFGLVVEVVSKEGQTYVPRWGESEKGEIITVPDESEMITIDSIDPKEGKKLIGEFYSAVCDREVADRGGKPSWMQMLDQLDEPETGFRFPTDIE